MPKDITPLLKKTILAGDRIRLFLVDRTELSGVFKGEQDGYLGVVVAQEEHWVSGEEIIRFVKEKGNSSSERLVLDEPLSASTAQPAVPSLPAAPVLPPERTVTPPIEPTLSQELAPIEDFTQSMVYKTLLSTWKIQPMTVIPEPHFAGLGPERRRRMTDFENRYQTAVRLKDLARLTDDVPRLDLILQSSPDPDVAYLAGLIAVRAGNLVKGEEFFQRALSLGSKSQGTKTPVWYGLAVISITRQNWQEAADNLCALLCLPDAEESLIPLLGQCLVRCNDLQRPGLAHVARKNWSEAAQQHVHALLAQALLQSAPQAALDAFRGHLDVALAQQPESLVVRDPIVAMTEYSGRITEYFPETNSGYIRLADRTFTFTEPDIIDPQLKQNLAARKPAQFVRFLGNPCIDYGRATAIRRELPPESPVPLSPSQPGSKGIFQQAKIAADTSQTQKAETLYLKTIQRKHPRWESAVKDLANLYNRTDPKQALALLEQYRSQMSNPRSVDNMRLDFLAKASLFDQAQQLACELQVGATSVERLRLAQREAYYAYGAGKYTEAIALLEKLLKDNPKDVTTQSLLSQIRDIQKTGQRDDTTMLHVIGLSPLSQWVLASCEYRGLDENAKRRGFYEKRDFDAIDARIKAAKGRRPRERADYLLTYSAMLLKSPHIHTYRSQKELLGSYFRFMGEAARNDSLPIDVARCFFSESLTSAPEDEYQPLFQLLATYMTPPPALDLRLDAKTLANHFAQHEDQWLVFTGDLAYYSYLAPQVLLQLHSIQSHRNTLILNADTLLEKREEAQERINIEISTLQTLVTSWRADALQAKAQQLQHCAQRSYFELDRRRLTDTVHILREVSICLNEADYTQREARVNLVLTRAESLLRDIREKPTRLSVEIYGAIEQFRSQLQQDFSSFVTNARTHLELEDVLAGDGHTHNNQGIVTLKLVLTSRPGGAPIQKVTIAILPYDGLVVPEDPIKIAEVLQPGKHLEFSRQIKPSDRQIAEGAFPIHIRVCWTNHKQKQEEQIFELAGSFWRMEGDQQISNPYQNYVTGNSIGVDDEEMFFGRKTLLHQISQQLLSGPMGTGFCVYGQMRVGKSSVLTRLQKMLDRHCVTVSLDMLTLDYHNLYFSFAFACISRLIEVLETNYQIQTDTFPTYQQIKDLPTQSLQKGLVLAIQLLHQHGVSNPRVLLLIDEFTRLYQDSEDVPLIKPFMEHWKGLLGDKHFSAVLIGQDIMPQFILAFANLFGTIKPIRINYLERDECYQMATAPIPLPTGESRYRGRALERIYELTAGSPFFMQILMDRLVRYMNKRGFSLITEVDVNEAARTLVSGDANNSNEFQSLELGRFHSLWVYLDRFGTHASTEAHLQLLTQIAHASARRGWARVEDLSPLPCRDAVLNDMKDREVLQINAGEISIRVKLFANWLCANREDRA